MFFKIQIGLFRYDFIDHHAVLGVAVDAEIKEVRKRYLQVARILHPDSCGIKNAEEKKLASDLLAKLVNPAYEKLSVERYRPEYLLILAQIGKRAAQEGVAQELTTELAQQLLIAPNTVAFYHNAIAEIAENQFTDFQKAVENISMISELNLVYLLKTSERTFNSPRPGVTENTSPASPVTSSPIPSAKENTPTAQYINRAQDLIAKNQFAAAKVELQDALKLEPKNSRCHSLIALVYFQQNQLKMAKIHFDNALKLDPNDKLALEWKPKVDRALGIQTPNGESPTKKPEKTSGQSGSGGLFGGLFGGKKK